MLFLSHRLFNEPVTSGKIIGIMLIILGIAVNSYRNA
jgi:multidrug transporter EmrE-like cation transporter